MGLGGRSAWVEFGDRILPVIPGEFEDFFNPKPETYGSRAAAAVSSKIKELLQSSVEVEGQVEKARLIAKADEYLELCRIHRQCFIAVFGFDDAVYPCISGLPYSPPTAADRIPTKRQCYFVKDFVNLSKPFKESHSQSLFNLFHRLLRCPNNPTRLFESDLHKHLVRNLCASAFRDEEYTLLLKNEYKKHQFSDSTERLEWVNFVKSHHVDRGTRVTSEQFEHTFSSASINENVASDSVHESSVIPHKIKIVKKKEKKAAKKNAT